MYAHYLNVSQVQFRKAQAKLTKRNQKYWTKLSFELAKLSYDGQVVLIQDFPWQSCPWPSCPEP